MSNSLSSWFKTDDIDGGLAADFDGSLSGLGVELGSSTYNMRWVVSDQLFKDKDSETACHPTVSVSTESS